METTNEEDSFGAASIRSHNSRNSLVPKVSSPVQENQNHFNRWKSRSFIMSSYFFSTIFLTFLMVGAMLRRSITHYVKKKPEPLENLQAAYPFSTNLKVIPDIKYYVNQLGLELQEYKVTTKDGFIIILQRIIDPSKASSELSSKPPILCVHGLLQCSASFITGGVKSLAHLLHSNNYDVWLGNNRCGFEPQHMWLDPSDPHMWEWDIIEMATKDLPAMINQVIGVSNHDKLSLVCHSQGTTQTFIALSKNFIPNEINDKINHFIALAPAVYGGPLLNEKLFITFINYLPATVYNIFFGIHSFMPIMMDFRRLIYRSRIFGFFAYSMFNFLFDWDKHLWDPTIITQHFVFSPVYVSSQLMKWWLSKNGFVNNKEILPDQESWFSDATPFITLFIANEDKLVDCDRLVRHLQNHEPYLRNFRYFQLDGYSHLDVLWADDVNFRIGRRILERLEEVHDLM